MKKYILSSIVLFCIVSCGIEENKVSNITPSALPKKDELVSPTPNPSPTSTSYIFKERKEAAKYLSCIAEALREPEKPALLVDLVIKMEKNNPPIPDSEALATYQKHISDALRIYPFVMTACPLPEKK
ncbi:MAG: hypothetical protein U0354_05260 [Candidatus Sericytochromatia bacterium]